MFIRFGKRVMAPEGDGTGGGGGTPPTAPTAADFAKLQASYADLASKFEKLNAGGNGQGGAPPKKTEEKPDDADLNAKAESDRKAKEKQASDHKTLEDALSFNMKSADFIKANQGLLPKEAADLVTQADKETYATAIDKANAVRAGIIKSFFSVKDNLDLLTGGPKSDLEEYLKLVPNERVERAPKIWASVFEPTLEMLRRVKKAQAVNGSGESFSTDAQSAHRQKMILNAKRHYLKQGEKSNGT